MNEGLVVLVRSTIAFFTLLVFAKILGKQQISQLTFFEYILGISIGSIASTLSTDLTSRAWPHWVGLFTWTSLGLLMQYITLRWRYVAKVVDGQPTIVIMNGKILESVLRKLKLTASDIMVLLRSKDVFDITQVDFAIIEPNGQLSVLKKSSYETITVKDMNINKKPSGISTELIYEGTIIHENLKQLNKNDKWLVDQLGNSGIHHVSEVFLATLNPSGSLYIDKYEDHIKRVLDMGDFKGPY